jgi:hypothetical protein
MPVEKLPPQSEPLAAQGRVTAGEARTRGLRAAVDAGRAPAAGGTPPACAPDRLSCALPGGRAIRTARVDQARQRIAEGYYDQPAVRQNLAARLLASLGLDRED